MSTNAVAPLHEQNEDELKRQLVTAVRSYVKAVQDSASEAFKLPHGELTATEVVICVSALIDSADLNLFDVAMWHRRPSLSPGRSRDWEKETSNG